MADLTKSFMGSLSAESPLRAVFTGGLIPLVSINTVNCKLGTDEKHTIEACYLLKIDACNPEELENMAQMMTRAGLGPIEEARATLATKQPLPIRAFHVLGVGFPARLAH